MARKPTPLTDHVLVVRWPERPRPDGAPLSGTVADVLLDDKVVANVTQFTLRATAGDLVTVGLIVIPLSRHGVIVPGPDGKAVLQGIVVGREGGGLTLSVSGEMRVALTGGDHGIEGPEGRMSDAVVDLQRCLRRIEADYGVVGAQVLDVAVARLKAGML